MTSDPYLLFEQLEHPETRRFAREAHGATEQWLAGCGGYASMRDDILAVLQDEEQIPFCQEHRAKMYHFHQSAEFPKGVYRVCSAASYRSGRPQWQNLFSVADFDGLLGDDVYFDGASHYIEAPQRVLLSLSPQGGDTAYTLEFDLEAGRLAEDGFHFPCGKNHIAWRDENSVWVCPAWEDGQLTDSGYPREVWLLTRGQRFEEAQLVFRTGSDAVSVHAWRYIDAQGAVLDIVEESLSFFRRRYYRVDGGGTAVPLHLPEDADLAGYLGGQLLLLLRSDWQRANARYRAGSLVAVKLNKGQLGEAFCLFEPSVGQSVENVETTRRFVAATLLDNVSGSLRAWKWCRGAWQPVNIPPGLPQGALEISDQPWGGDVLYLAGSDFLTPLTLYTADLARAELCVMRRQKPQFDASGLSVRQFHAVSADGTLVPYYRVGTEGAAPTLVYVYGGFGVAELPHYAGVIGRHWLARGGAFVLANVRGGGEFGPAWHQAAQGAADKHRSVDDLIAVLDDLADRCLAVPQQIAVQGGSNGGLVTASAYCRAPDKMGALVCEVPLTDMLRYPYLFAGASWLEEYGDPADPADTGYLKALSPYHNIDEGTAYPPAWISTHLSDDRVHPAHALKFYARLLDVGAPVRLYAPTGGGHSGNSGQADTAAELAAVLSFLWATVGKTACGGGLCP